MRECLPPQLLKEKLPRFLQKCAQTFQTDRHYSNDTRYLRVWLQLVPFLFLVYCKQSFYRFSFSFTLLLLGIRSAGSLVITLYYCFYLQIRKDN